MMPSKRDKNRKNSKKAVVDTLPHSVSEWLTDEECSGVEDSDILYDKLKVSKQCLSNLKNPDYIKALKELAKARQELAHLQKLQNSQTAAGKEATARATADHRRHVKMDSSSDSDEYFHSDAHKDRGMKSNGYKLNKSRNITSSGAKKAMVSGLYETADSSVVNPQIFPHSQLKRGFLRNGLDGVHGDIKYNDLTFGLFVAGELEIISNPRTDPLEATRRRELLKVTAYRSEYVEWPKLRHLHAAILQEVESGEASWGSSFEQVEKMVLENPGKTGRGHHTGMSNKHWQKTPTKTFYCWEFNNTSCSRPSPHDGNIKGIACTVKHVCATCMRQENIERDHPQGSTYCPYFHGDAENFSDNSLFDDDVMGFLETD